MIGDITRSALPLATWLLLGAVPLMAQQAGADSATDVQGYAPPAETDKSPPAPAPVAAASSNSAAAVVLPRRTEADVEQGLRAADQALNRAGAELARLQQRGEKTQALLRSQESRAAELEAQKQRADKEKRKSDKSGFEAQKKAVERQKALTEQLKALNDAEIEAARKAVEVAIAKQHALELERTLIGKRAEGSALVPDLERETLVAQKLAAGLERDLAGKKAFVSSKRLDVYEASREAKKP
jgi:hypothetical protein